MAILDAAASVFMKLGFAAASLDDISDNYGATKGIIYYHFRSKTALFFAVQRRAMELTRAAIEPAALASGSARERMEQMAFAHTLLMMEHLDYLRVAAQGLELHLGGRTTEEERAEMKRITTLRDNNERLYLKVLEEGVSNEEFRPMDARIAVKPLLGALNWTSRWYQPRKGETRADREVIATEIARYAVHGLLQHGR
ncbi:TetR family transcriptional regulator (plasmid) [Cupriavidus basilensis]